MKILIAEDEIDILNLIKISLEENGYSVLAVQNGKEALDRLLSEHIDLAILDVMMPVMDGFICSVKYANIAPFLLFSSQLGPMTWIKYLV
jgi:DNA-binding response OmpR family regulator